MKCNELILDEKLLRKKIKEETDALHIKTKETIEGLNDEEVKTILKEKWIINFVKSLYSMPDTIIDDLILKVSGITTKYNETFEDVEKNIMDTEKELCVLLDDLCGNEFDLKGISEFKALLMGELNGRK